MQVFSYFLKTVRNHLPVLSIYAVAFLAISIYLTSTLKSGEETMFQAASLTIGVKDEDDSEASLALVKFLEQRHHVTPVSADPEKNYDDLFYRYVDYILTIPKGFEAQLMSSPGSGSLLSGQALPSSSGAVFVDSQISEFLTALKMQLASGGDITAAVGGTQKIFAGLPGVQTLKVAADASSGTLPIWYFFRYLPYVLINLMVLGLGTVLAGVKEEGFMTRLHVSPLRPGAFRLRMISAGVLYALLVWGIFFAASQILYPGQISGRAFFCSAANTLAFTLVSLSIAVFASSLARGSRRSRTAVINMFSNTFSLAMSFFCGVFVPLEYLGDGVKKVAHFLPAYWYVRLNSALEEGSSAALSGGIMSFVFRCIFLQLVFAALFLILAVFTDRRQAAG